MGCRLSTTLNKGCFVSRCTYVLYAYFSGTTVISQCCWCSMTFWRSLETNMSIYLLPFPSVWRRYWVVVNRLTPGSVWISWQKLDVNCGSFSFSPLDGVPKLNTKIVVEDGYDCGRRLFCCPGGFWFLKACPSSLRWIVCWISSSARGQECLWKRSLVSRLVGKDAVFTVFYLYNGLSKKTGNHVLCSISHSPYKASKTLVALGRTYVIYLSAQS